MTAKHIQEAWDKLRQERDALTARLATAEQRSEELAAQVEVMRDVVRETVTDLEGLFVRCRVCGNQEDTVTLDCVPALRKALDLPNTAILRQRDATPPREAIDQAAQGERK